MKRIRYLSFTILLMLFCFSCNQQNQTISRVAVYDPNDPSLLQSSVGGPIESSVEINYDEILDSKVGIALGGGGAKAAAEIGALKVMEEAGIKPRYIAGSSMGAVVGGLYAAGYTANELDSLFLTEDWLSLFEKREIGLISNQFRTVFGLVRGDVFEEKLSSALLKKGCITMEDTKYATGITFACTATNIVNEEDIEDVVLKDDHINLAKAIRASMTYPAPVVGYRPVSIDGMLLVDGGMLNNLPVDVIRDLGAEHLIAVDLEKDRKEERLMSLNGLLNLTWLTNWLVHRHGNNKRNQNIEMAHIVIQPPLSGYSILDFTQQELTEMMELGEDEARTYHWKSLLELKQ